MTVVFFRKMARPLTLCLAGLQGYLIVPLHAQERGPAETKPLEMIQVAEGGGKFVLADSGKTFVPWGFNYVGDFGRIVEEYWDEDWSRVEKDFREMRRLGANVVRLHLQLGTYLKTPETVDRSQLNRLKRILDLGEKTGLYLDLTGLGCYHLDRVPPW